MVIDTPYHKIMDSNDLTTPVSAEEAARLDELYRYQILNTSEEPVFDQIVQTAAKVFSVPIALLSMVDLNEVFYKAKVGMEENTFPRNKSLCTIAILKTSPLILHYDESEQCLLNNPMIGASEYGLKFYASIPLVTPNDMIIGTLSIADMNRRTFSSQDLDILQDLANVVMHTLNGRLDASKTDEVQLA